MITTSLSRDIYYAFRSFPSTLIWDLFIPKHKFSAGRQPRPTVGGNTMEAFGESEVLLWILPILLLQNRVANFNSDGAREELLL